MFVSDTFHRESHFTMRSFCVCDSLMAIITGVAILWCTQMRDYGTTERYWLRSLVMSRRHGEWVSSPKRKIKESYVSESENVHRFYKGMWEKAPQKPITRKLMVCGDSQHVWQQEEIISLLAAECLLNWIEPKASFRHIEEPHKIFQ